MEILKEPWLIALMVFAVGIGIALLIVCIHDAIEDVREARRE